MKLTDNTQKTVIELSYAEAEHLYTIARNYDDTRLNIFYELVSSMKGKKEIIKKERLSFERFKKTLTTKLDEYLNT